MSPAALLAAIAMPLFIAIATSLASAMISLAYFILTPTKRALKTTPKKDVFSFALGGLANTVSVSVSVGTHTQPHAAPAPAYSIPPTQVSQQQHVQPVCATPSETASTSSSVLAAANAKMKRVKRTARALECAKVPGVVELPIRGMQCAVM
jgi:hypothetical protein